MKYLLLLIVCIISACAYVAGNGNATVTVDRKLDIDSTINQDRNKQVRQLPQATPSTGDKQE